MPSVGQADQAPLTSAALAGVFVAQIDAIQVASRIATIRFFATGRSQSGTPPRHCAPMPGPAQPVPRFTAIADSRQRALGPERDHLPLATFDPTLIL